MLSTVLFELINLIIVKDEECQDFDEELLNSHELCKLSMILSLQENKIESKHADFVNSLIVKYKSVLPSNMQMIRGPDKFTEVFKCKCGINTSILVSHSKKSITSCCNFGDIKVGHNNLDLVNIYSLATLYAAGSIEISPLSKIQINKYLNSINYISNKSLKVLKLNTLNDTLKPYQKVGVISLLINRKMILADEMGLGKTIQAFIAAKESKSKRILYVCPATLKNKIKNEYLKFFPDEKVTILEKSVKSFDADIYITNYDALRGLEDLIYKLKPDFVIFDEIHNIKNPKSIRTKMAKKVSKCVKYSVGLSGTPAINKVVDLVSQIEAIGRLADVFGGYWSFIQRYCPCQIDELELNGNSRISSLEIDDNDDLLDIRTKLTNNCYIRRTQTQVGLNLPNSHRLLHPLILQNQKGYIDLINKYQNAKDTKIGSLSSIKNDMRMFLATERAYESIKMIDQFIKEGRKIVAFCCHDVIKQILVNKYKERCLTIFREDSPKQRADIELEFLKNTSENILISTVKVGYAGYNFTSACTMIAVEMDWRSEVNSQLEARLTRIGSTKDAECYYPYFIDTIDEDIISINNKKSKSISVATKNPNEPVFKLE
jgi:SNF2 family DNA or RNA helicase